MHQLSALSCDFTFRSPVHMIVFVPAGSDSLGYLSVDGLMKVVGGTSGGFCDACFTGNYPVPVQLELNKLVLENGSRRSVG